MFFDFTVALRKEIGMTPAVRIRCYVKDWCLWAQGKLYSLLGYDEYLASTLERVVALRLQYLGVRHSRTAHAMVKQALVEASLSSRNYARSHELLKEAQRTFVRRYGKYHLDVAYVLGCRAYLNEREANFTAATKLYICAHKIYRNVDRYSLDHLWALERLMTLLRLLRRDAEIADYQRHADEIQLYHDSVYFSALSMIR